MGTIQTETRDPKGEMTRVEQTETREKTRWLGRYRAALEQEQALVEEITWLRSDTERMGSVLAGTPGEGGAALPRAVQQIDAARAELESQVERSLMLRGEIARSIAALPDPRWREVLHRRFLLGQSQEEAARGMHVSLRSLQRFQTQAVRALTVPPAAQAGVGQAG